MGAFSTDRLRNDVVKATTGRSIEDHAKAELLKLLRKDLNDETTAKSGYESRAQLADRAGIPWMASRLRKMALDEKWHHMYIEQFVDELEGRK